MNEISVPDRYRRALRESDFRDLVAEARGLLARLEQEGPSLLRRARQPSGDGYPGSSLAGGGSKSVTDSTSVERAVLRREKHGDVVGDLAAEMCQALLVARDAAKVALDKWGRSVKNDKPCWKCAADRLNSDEWCPQCGAGDEPGCVVHAQYGLQEPVRARGRCRWCNDWSRDWLRDHDEIRDPSEADIRDREAKRIQRELGRAA